MLLLAPFACIFYILLIRMIQYMTENSRAPPMRHHGFKMAWQVCGTHEMYNCLNLFLLNKCYHLSQYIFLKNISTYVEVTIKIHVILDFPSYIYFTLIIYKQPMPVGTTNTDYINQPSRNLEITYHNTVGGGNLYSTA